MSYQLLDIIAVSPLNEKPSDQCTCIVCKSKNVRTSGKMSTLLAGGSGIDDDPNHTWEGVTCSSCHIKVTRETKSGNVWYTKDRVVLAGVPSCYETYVYPCKCGGKITRTYTDLEGSNTVRGLSMVWKDGGYVPQYRIFYECDSCNIKIEVNRDSWGGK